MDFKVSDPFYLQNAFVRSFATRICRDLKLMMHRQDKLKFCSPHILGIFLTLVLMPTTLLSEGFRIIAPDYNLSDGIIKLGWESALGNVYSLESSTNLTDWSEVKGVAGPLRFTGTVSNRIDIEISAPAALVNFYRLRN